MRKIFFSFSGMKRIFISFSIFLLLFSAWCGDVRGKEKVEILLFYSPHCRACLFVKKEVLPPLLKKYSEVVTLKELNIYEPQNWAFLLSLSARYKKKGSVVPTIVIGDTLLVGRREIQDKLEKEIVKMLGKKKEIKFSFSQKIILDKFKEISFLTLIGAGLIDGINPCAFAVIVFFVSFLAVYGYRKEEVLGIGIAYILAVFVTYLLIGLGIFKFLYALSNFYFVIKMFYYLVAGICFLLFGLALYDFFRFKKDKSGQDFILQLPKFLKKKINIVIGSALRQKRSSYLSLFLISLGVGFVVSLLEAVCTGQVYLPTIFFILKVPSLRFKALFYLIIYNFMFVLPLILVFLLSLVGVSSQTFNDFLKRNLGKAKLALAMLFLCLGILIIVTG